ncbi:MAG: PAS domain S-box protein [Rhodospirillaceae bacterium]|nr:PAS domain S-box protein [Rhodospirillaceae bacterium]
MDSLLESGKKPGLWRRLRMAREIVFGRPGDAGVSQDALVQLILDHVDAAITVYDAAGKLISANKGAERLSGFSFAELQRPETWRHIIPGADFARVTEILTGRRTADFPIVNVNPWVHKDGTRRLLRWSNVALPDARGDVALLVCIGFDITEQRQTEINLIKAKNEAETANRAKSEFLANMSHELRTPLNAILGFSEVIRDRQFGPDLDRYSEYAAHIHDSGEWLLSLISDVLDMAKLEAGKMQLVEEVTDLGDIVDGCLRMVSVRAQEGGIALVPKLPRQPVRLLVDQKCVKQILLNLLSNAIKFTPSGGRIELEVSNPRQDGVRLVVSDTGIGIPAANMRQLFQPFHQVESTLTRGRGGTGLGLAITKRLTELHGGTIDVDSSPGTGTTVTVALPSSRLVA